MLKLCWLARHGANAVTTIAQPHSRCLSIKQRDNPIICFQIQWASRIPLFAANILTHAHNMPVLHARAFGESSVSAPTIIAIFASIFFVLIIISLIFNGKARQSRREVAQRYQYVPLQQQAESENIQTRRLRKQYRSNGQLGWNEQRNGDDYSMGLTNHGELLKYGDRRDDMEAAIGRPPPSYQP
jgi:hypothetical protein